MSKATTTDRKAAASEVRAHAEQVRQYAQEVGVSEPRLRADGTVVVHSEQPGYRDVVVLSQRLTDLVGCYVHVITDDLPGADDDAGVRDSALLGFLDSTLRQIQSWTPSDKAAWAADQMRQLAIKRLWITAGNVAETRKTAELGLRLACDT